MANDPVNATDPSGMQGTTISVTGSRTREMLHGVWQDFLAFWNRPVTTQICGMGCAKAWNGSWSDQFAPTTSTATVGQRVIGTAEAMIAPLAGEVALSRFTIVSLQRAIAALPEGMSPADFWQARRIRDFDAGFSRRIYRAELRYHTGS